MKKLISLAFVGMALPGAALAQSCTTTSPGSGVQQSCIPGGVPQLSGLSGAVSLVRAGKVTPAANGMKLMAGDRLVSLAGSGNLALAGAQGGLCSVPLVAQSSITISQSAAGTCATPRTSVPAPEASLTQPSLATSPAPLPPVAPVVASAPTGLSPLAIGIGGAIIAGGAGIAIAQSSSDRLSP